MALKLLLAPESEADDCKDATRGIPLGDAKGPSRAESPDGKSEEEVGSGHIVATLFPPCASWLLTRVSRLRLTWFRRIGVTKELCRGTGCEDTDTLISGQHLRYLI
jgi:hypothetical protein